MSYKYFVKDEALNTVDKDELGHEDLANIVRKMIDNTSTPFNIAVVGKWGMGKSSLINLVKTSLEQNQNDYVVAEINAWKYQKEEFGRAFLKKLLESVKKESFTSQEQFVHVLNQSINSTKDANDKKNSKIDGSNFLEKIKNFFCENKKRILFLLIIVLLSFLSVFVYKCVAFSVFPNKFSDFRIIVRETFLSYCKNVIVVLFAPLVIWFGKIYMDQIVAKQNLQMEVSIPLETRDDYEIYLRAALKNQKNKKVITIIDDLDRLSSEKIVEALDAIKIFMDLENCIFIVPFDDAILKKALSNKRIQDLNSTESELNSELVLDKLFQYKIYIPEMIKMNIKEYAVNVFKDNCGDFVKEYMNNNMDEACRIVRNIIIHNNVKTPRQVKKLLNAFINNVMLAVEREKNNENRNVCLETGLVTSNEGMRLLAKISVLQADFNEFYDLLFIDSNLITKIMDVHSGSLEEVPELLENYFDIISERIRIKTQYQPLIDYLYYTNKYDKRSIIPYLYLSQDSVSAFIGDKKQQEFLAAVVSGNLPSVISMLEETPELAKFLERYLNTTDDNDEVVNACITGINVIKSVKKEYTIGIVSEITNRLKTSITYSEDSGINRVDFDCLFFVKSKSDEPEVYDEILQIFIKESLESDVTIQLFNSVLLHKNEVSSETDKLLREKLNEFCLEYEYVTGDINALCEELKSDCVFEYINDCVFKKVIDEAIEYQTFDEDALNDIKFYFNVYVNGNNINQYVEWIKKMATFYELHDTLNQLLSRELISGFTLKNSTSLVEKIIDIRVENIVNSSFELLLKLPLDIDEMEELEKLDEFISVAVDRFEHFSSLIRHFVEGENDIDILSRTIEQVSSKAMQEEKSLYLVCDIADLYSEEQKKDISEKIKNEVVYKANYDYAHEKKVISMLYQKEDFKEIVFNNVIGTIVPNVNSYYNKLLYVDFSIFVIETVINEMESEYIQRIINSYMKTYKLFPTEIINTINNISVYLNESMKIQVINTYKDDLSEKDIDAIAIFYYNNSDVFNEQNDNVSDFIDFIVENIEKLANAERAYKEIEKLYSRIGVENLISLSEYSLGNKDIISQAGTSLRKFYQKITLDDYANILLHFIRVDISTELYELLFNNDKEDKCGQVIRHLLQSKNELLKEDMLLLVDFIEENKLDKKDELVLLLKEFLNKNQEVDSNRKILHLISEKIQNKLLQKKEVCDLLYIIYTNTSSIELKKEVSEKVKLYGLVKKFKSLLSEESKEEFEKL